MERWWMVRLQLDRVSFSPRKPQCILVLVLAAWRNYLFIEEFLHPSFLERHPKQQGIRWKNGAPLKVATFWFMVISDNILTYNHMNGRKVISGHLLIYVGQWWLCTPPSTKPLWCKTVHIWSFFFRLFLALSGSHSTFEYHFCLRDKWCKGYVKCSDL